MLDALLVSDQIQNREREREGKNELNVNEMWVERMAVVMTGDEQNTSVSIFFLFFHSESYVRIDWKIVIIS